MIGRRQFLRNLIGGVAAASAVRAWPFRVFSFPTEIKPISIQAAADFLGPGVIEINRYQAEIFDLVRRRFVFGERLVGGRIIQASPMGIAEEEFELVDA